MTRSPADQPMDRTQALSLLGLEPDTQDPLDPATLERAYRGHLDIYREGALASYALMDGGERSARLVEIEAAYKLLALPAEEPKAEPSPAVPSRPPPYDPSAPGASLRRAREHQRLGLDELASRTRILRSHLEALQQERYDTLPPVAYVRGFALQYARALGIAEAEDLAQEIVSRARNG